MLILGPELCTAQGRALATDEIGLLQNNAETTCTENARMQKKKKRRKTWLGYQRIPYTR